MNDNEFNLAARAWLDDGPSRISDRALLSALEEIHTTRQRRALWPAWRATPVSIFARVGMAAVLVVAVGLLAVSVLPGQPDGSNVGGLSPSPTPSPSPTAAQSVDYPSMTKTFVSPTYGYSFKYPRAAIAPATEPWDPDDQPLADVDFDPRFDGLETGYLAYFEGASTELPDGVSIDDWVDEFITPVAAGGCGVPRSQQADITIDGQPAKMAQCGHSEATVVAGGRLYLFLGPHDDRDWFEAWVATIDLRPEDAATPSASPSP